MKTALIIVDYQNDFLPNGALPVPDSMYAYVPITQQADREDIDLIMLSRDWHPADHMSFTAQGGPWPPHCVRDTEGAQIDQMLQDHLKDIGTPQIVVNKGQLPDREAYSAFNPVFGVCLGHNDVDTVVICGLALDYCVKATALDAQRFGYDTTVALDATRPVSYYSGALAIAEMIQMGVKVQ